MDKVRIFISYAHADIQQVEPIYQRLRAEGFEPWLDEEELLPGMIWLDEIKKAVRAADFFFCCLSKHSANRSGVIQREIKTALDAWEARRPGDIYFIPVLLEECEVPEHLQQFQ
jgi:hypothetical protein